MRKKILFSVIASEFIHVFCCVLPTLFSVMSLLAGMGVIAVMPNFIGDLHDMIHSYEILMIVTSGTILLIGWGFYLWSRRMNCSEEGASCSHGPCAPKKDRTRIVMIIATVLFIVNISVYFGVHRPNDVNIHQNDHHLGYHDDDEHY